MTARHLGAHDILAIDFDAAAIKTSKKNEALNFARPLIRWRQGDVTNLRMRRGYQLILANLFSGILIEAAPRIAAALTADGYFWLSGVLRPQEAEVTAAYHRQKLQLVRSVRRGKWIMQQWKREHLG